jgi:hypothetical protein
MFDRHHHHLHVAHVTESVTKNVNVTEKRAPTDESVRLLREMEAAAKAAIIGTIRVTDTPVECVIHSMYSQHGASRLFRVVYSLNGAKRTVDYERSDTGRLDADREEIIVGLRDALAKDIASVLVSATLDKALRAVFP